MGCCGGSRPQQVRRQAVAPNAAKEKPQVVQHRVSRQSAQPAPIQRQHVVPRQQCVKCGYITMVVIIAGRERHQCSNANCRMVAS